MNTAESSLAATPPVTESFPERAPLTRAELALIFGFWTLIAVLTSANTLLEPRAPGLWQPVVPLAPVLIAFANSYLWALLTPPIFWLASRNTLERSGWLSRAMLIVVGLALAISVDLATSYLRQQLFYAPHPLSPELVAIARLRRLWFMNEFIVYVAVLAAGFARNYFICYRARREEGINLKAQAARLQAQLADARLSALRNQLNPHFLFNTLHAVSALVERDPRGVRRMVARLSELLRTTLDAADEPEVPLQREITFIERYLEVMQIRFQGKLDVAIEVDPATREALVPNLILQPLVENALKHGVSRIVGTGSIRVSACERDGRLELAVRDNGPGLAGRRLPLSEGVGLRNTRERLQQLYGGEHTLTLREAEGGGVVAEVSLPFRAREVVRIPVAAEA